MVRDAGDGVLPGPTLRHEEAITSSLPVKMA